MNIRIKPSYRGTKGLDWERYYKVEVKSFLFWSKIAEFGTIKQAMDYVEKLGSFHKVEYIK